MSLPATAGLPDVIAAARPGVVAVGTFNALENPRFAFRGSGFVVGDGTLVVTNQHVLPQPSEVEALQRLAVLVARGRARRRSRAPRASVGVGPRARPGAADASRARRCRALRAGRRRRRARRHGRSR
ncbi:MAG: serine protease [Comamonadaceae bacterium]|nr:serine protease [Comamonadaceae bacterium]